MGPHYTHSGSGSNLLCAHEHPTWSKNNVAGIQTWSGRLFGTEFEVFPAGGYKDNKPLDSSNLDGDDIGNQDALCVLCYVPNSSTNFMVTGRQDCGNSRLDAKLEYKGVIMSRNYFDRKRTENSSAWTSPRSRGLEELLI